MEKIIISTDSTADVMPEVRKERKIEVASLHVIMGEKDLKDGVDVTTEDVFRYVEETGQIPKTSAVSVAEYEEYFAALLEKGESVLHFNISGECSVTCRNAAEAAKKFDGKVVTVDSRQLSSGQQLLVLKACDLRDEGKPLATIVKTVEKLKSKVQTSFVVDTVDNLYKGGRCTAAAMVVSKLLKIHPAIRMEGGTLGVKKKYIGTLKRCISAYVDDLAEEFTSYDDTRVFVTHACCEPSLFDMVVEKVKEKFHFKEVLINTSGCVISSHCGQNALGVLFVTE